MNDQCVGCNERTRDMNRIRTGYETRTRGRGSSTFLAEALCDLCCARVVAYCNGTVALCRVRGPYKATVVRYRAPHGMAAALGIASPRGRGTGVYGTVVEYRECCDNCISRIQETIRVVWDGASKVR